MTPPSVRLLTTRVTAGRPLLVAEGTDLGSGVDPLSLVIGYGNALVGASAYDPFSGLAVFDLPTDAPKLKVGTPSTLIQASDFQESKNIDTVGADLYPNTAFKKVKLTVVSGPAVDWILPYAGDCALKNDRLVATATLGEEGLERRLRGRRQAGRRRQGRLRRRLLRRLAHGQADQGQAHAHRHRHRQRRGTARPRPRRCASAASAAARRRRDRSVLGDRRRAGPDAAGAGLAHGRRVAPGRPSADEHEDVRRRRPRRGGGARCPRARAPRAHRPAGEQRGLHRRDDFVGGDPVGIEAMIRANYLGSVWVANAFLPGLGRGSHIVNIVSIAGEVAGRPVLGVEARAARVLALAGRRARAPRHRRAHREARPRRDAGLSPPPARAARGRLAVDPSLVVERILGAVEHDRREITVPRWYRAFAIAQAVMPATFTRARQALPPVARWSVERLGASRSSSTRAGAFLAARARPSTT